MATMLVRARGWDACEETELGVTFQKREGKSLLINTAINRWVERKWSQTLLRGIQGPERQQVCCSPHDEKAQRKILPVFRNTRNCCSISETPSLPPWWAGPGQSGWISAKRTKSPEALSQCHLFPFTPTWLVFVD